MKNKSIYLYEIIQNPIGIGVMVMHWMVVFYSVYGEEHSRPFHFIYEPLLTQWLYLLNFPALILAGILSIPIISIFGQNNASIYICLLFSFMFISLQWLIVGYLINRVINNFKPNNTIQSLTDE